MDMMDTKEVDLAFHKLEVIEVAVGIRDPSDLTENKIKCADGGICHHKCKNNSPECCFRQQCCSPLGESDSWDDFNAAT